MLKYLGDTKGIMNLHSRHVNDLTTAITRAIYVLFGFGLYNNEDGTANLREMSDVLDSILPLLDTKTDRSDAVAEGDVDPRMYDLNEDALAMVNAKLAISDVCMFTFDCRQEKRLTIAYQGMPGGVDGFEKWFSKDCPAGTRISHALTPQDFDADYLDSLKTELFGKPLISSKVAFRLYVRISIRIRIRIRI